MGKSYAVTDFVQGAMCEQALGRPVEIIVECNAYMAADKKAA